MIFNRPDLWHRKVDNYWGIPRDSRCNFIKSAPKFRTRVSPYSSIHWPRSSACFVYKAVSKELGFRRPPDESIIVIAFTWIAPRPVYDRYNPVTSLWAKQTAGWCRDERSSPHYWAEGKINTRMLFVSGEAQNGINEQMNKLIKFIWRWSYRLRKTRFVASNIKTFRLSGCCN